MRSIEASKAKSKSRSSSTNKPEPQSTTPTTKDLDHAGLSQVSSAIGKVLAFVLVGTLLVFATDYIEITKSSDESPDAADITVKRDHNHTSNDILPSEEETSSNASSTFKEDIITTNENNLESKNLIDNQLWYTYPTRGRPLTNDERQKLIDEWGSWEFTDNKEKIQDDYFEKYLNRDIPRSEFPSNAWQIDIEYLSKFLPEGIALVERAQKAILAEYGQNTDEMFHVEQYDTLNGIDPKSSCDDCMKKGGWTTKQSWEGLKRRILHAIMTEDRFVFAMGGHSAAAGHGNHFQQSYTLQVQKILEPIFARLGVRHQSRNFGNGGLGTVHNGIAAGSIYGPDVDIIMWDSGMTEKEPKAQELFARQALLGGVKVPILWSLASAPSILFNNFANIDVGMPGDGTYGIRKAEVYEDVQAIPWAIRYMSCSNDLKSVCKGNEYNGTCWIDRPDYVPETKQDKAPGGRASWHPGFRRHQLQGRVLAYTFLQALKESLMTWNDSENYELSDDIWHVSSHYEGIRSRLLTIPPEKGKCWDYTQNGITFFCNHVMKGRTEFTPRAYPSLTSIRSLMPSSMTENLNDPAPNAYNPPDVYNPYLHPPSDEIDVLSIIELGTEFRPIRNPSMAEAFYKKPSFLEPPKVECGKGIRLGTTAGDLFCDGSLDSFCGRSNTSSCLLAGHNDGRNGLYFDSYSGWIVMNIPDLRNGFVLVKFESWHKPNSVGITSDWTSINNERKNRQLESHSSSESFRRDLKKKPPPPPCGNFNFDYAIDGNITTITVTEFKERQERGKLQRVVETLVLLEDPDYTGGKEQEVEVAIRLRGCGTQKTFKLTHIYWS